MAMRQSVVLVLMLAFCGSLGWAQVNSATISGTVRDESGAVLPGASVVVTNQDTGAARALTATAAGRYSAPGLSLGNFEVRAQLAGFQTAVRSGIALTVGRSAVVDLTLQVGAVTQTVEVTGEAPLIELTNANLTGLVDDRTIRELPLNGRSYDQLALLQPGIVKYTTSGDSFNGSPGGNKFSASGSLATANSFLLDGTDINDASNNTPGGGAGTNLGVDTIKEFKIVTAGSAEYGRSSGAVISAVSRTGTNQLHGSAFEFIGTVRSMRGGSGITLTSMATAWGMFRHSAGTSSAAPSAARSSGTGHSSSGGMKACARRWPIAQRSACRP